MKKSHCEARSLPANQDGNYRISCSFFTAGVSLKEKNNNLIIGFAHTLRKIQFANNEHPLCSALAKQLILVWDWTCATAKAVRLFCSEKYCNEELQQRGFLSLDSSYIFIQFLSLHKKKYGIHHSSIFRNKVTLKYCRKRQILLYNKKNRHKTQTQQNKQPLPPSTKLPLYCYLPPSQSLLCFLHQNSGTHEDVISHRSNRS